MHKYLVFAILISASSAYANNAAYVTLSNQMARTTQLGMVANNVANVSTTGYEMNDVLLSPVDAKASKRKTNSFVFTDAEYLSENQGPLKSTGRPLDLAITGDGYFKILTDNGDRYTLDGAMMPNRDMVLVNAHGMPYASVDNQPLILPATFTTLDIGEDGTIYADKEAIGQVGVFTFQNKSSLRREGKNLYFSTAGDAAAENAVIVSGMLRGSNVNSAKAMSELIDLQRSVSATNSLMSDIISTEKTAIAKMTSQK
ncbi:MAG: flagellar hook basal-body protein [Pseudomonadota bacterium]